MQRFHLCLLIALTRAIGVANAQDGFVGIYADAQGTVACTTVPQWSGTTVFVVANLEGATASGITAAEFRIEVSNPSGWYFTYDPPTGTTVLGTLLDTDPYICRLEVGGFTAARKLVVMK
jgi:hypothetical protein